MQPGLTVTSAEAFRYFICEFSIINGDKTLLNPSRYTK